MIRILTSGGVAALALLVVLATSLKSRGLVRCHVTQELMSVACCDAVTTTASTTFAASAPPGCCEIIDRAPPALMGGVAERTTRNSTIILPLPYPHVKARLDHQLRALPPHQQVLVARHRSTNTPSRLPAYDRYCSYLL